MKNNYLEWGILVFCLGAPLQIASASSPYDHELNCAEGFVDWSIGNNRICREAEPERLDEEETDSEPRFLQHLGDLNLPLGAMYSQGAGEGGGGKDSGRE